MGEHSDDDVGKPKARDDGRQTQQQRDILGPGGPGGRTEIRPTEGKSGRSPPVRGGSSQGSGDRTELHEDVGTDLDRKLGRHPQPEPGEG